MRNHSPGRFGAMKPAQRLSFSLLQLFYPSVAISWLLGNALTALYLLGGSAVRLPVDQWFVLWLASMTTSLGTFFWLRRFNLAEHERSEWGMAGLGLLLICAPVYVSAALAFLTGRPLAYAVTAKGKLTSGDTVATFRPHLWWLAASVALLVASVGLGLGQSYPTLTFWLCVTVATCSAPLIIHARTTWRGRPNRQVATHPGPPETSTIAGTWSDDFRDHRMEPVSA
jgi:hypothetical protein